MFEKVEGQRKPEERVPGPDEGNWGKLLGWKSWNLSS